MYVWIEWPDVTVKPKTLNVLRSFRKLATLSTLILYCGSFFGSQWLWLFHIWLHFPMMIVAWWWKKVTVKNWSDARFYDVLFGTLSRNCSHNARLLSWEWIQRISHTVRPVGSDSYLRYQSLVNHPSRAYLWSAAIVHLSSRDLSECRLNLITISLRRKTLISNSVIAVDQSLTGMVWVPTSFPCTQFTLLSQIYCPSSCVATEPESGRSTTGSAARILMLLLH